MARRQAVGVDLLRILILDVLDGTATLDAANGEALPVSEAADDPGLPLERALQRLIKLGWILEVNDVDVSVGRANHQEIPVYPHVHGVHTLLTRDRGGRRALAEIPVLHRLVPRTGHHHGGAVGVEEADTTDWTVVLGNLHRLARGHVADLGFLVCTSRNNSLAILGYQLDPKSSKYLLS